MTTRDSTPPPAAPPRPPVSIVATDDVPESFDDDLGWILSKYLERTLALGGALTIHHGDGRAPEILFAFGAAAEDETLIPAMLAAAARIRWQDRLGERPAAEWEDLTGAVRALSVALAGDADQRVILTSLHPGGDPAVMAPSEAMGLRLQPVLAGYFKLWLVNRAQRRRLDAYASALNHTDIAILLLDGHARIVFVNEAGRALLDDTDGIRRVGRGLAGTDPADATRLRVAIDHVIALEREEGRPPRDAKPPVVSLRRRGDRRALITAILPVERGPTNPSDPVAILYIFTPDIDVGQLLRPICHVYSLSPAETRLAGLLAEGLSVTEAAERMRVKVPTLRTYLKQIFAKTGTSRQGDLIRLLMVSLVRTRTEVAPHLI